MPLKPKTAIRRSEPTGLVCIDSRHRLSMPESKAGARVYFSQTRGTGDLYELCLTKVTDKPKRLIQGRLVSARIRRSAFALRTKGRKGEAFAIVSAPKARLPSRSRFARPRRSNHFVSLDDVHRRLQRSWL